MRIVSNSCYKKAVPLHQERSPDGKTKLIVPLRLRRIIVPMMSVYCVISFLPFWMTMPL